jgi:chemotaxis signal transduction protein
MSSAAESVALDSDAVLLLRLGGRRYGLPLGQVERVLPMAAVCPLPDQPTGMLGVLNLHGAVLPVVDPRPRLGLASPAWTADQRLVVLATASQRFLLWVDELEDVVDHAAEALSAIGSADGQRLTTHVLRWGDELVPILSPLALQECGSGR